MALDSFASLKIAIADHLNKSNLTTYIPDFITLAESRHKRDIRIREMLERADLTIDARYEDIPAGLLEALQIRLLTTPVSPVDFVSIENMTTTRRDGTGKPKKFTLHEQIEFDIAPDSTYSGEIIYYKALTPLSDAATSNALLARAPDAYLYGALAASAPFLLNDERLQIWDALYKDAVGGLNQARRQERSVGPLFARVHGSTP
jgi:hypothetical protein